MIGNSGLCGLPSLDMKLEKMEKQRPLRTRKLWASYSSESRAGPELATQRNPGSVLGLQSAQAPLGSWDQPGWGAPRGAPPWLPSPTCAHFEFVSFHKAKPYPSSHPGSKERPMPPWPSWFTWPRSVYLRIAGTSSGCRGMVRASFPPFTV